MSGIIGGVGSKSGVIGQTEQDYEEGAWTPVAKAGGTAMATNTGNDSPAGRYIKKGKVVHIWMALWGLPVGSSSGAITIEGLPFTARANYNQAVSYFSSQNDYTSGAYNPQPIYRIDAGATTIAVYDVGSSGTWQDPYDIHDLTNYLFMRGNATYLTD